MKRLFITSITTLVLGFTSCQSGVWNVNGTCEGLADGDTVYITKDFRSGIPMDTAIVEDGEFEFSGDQDTTLFCMVYSPKNDALSRPFFIEKGTVNIVLSENPMKSKISGTPMNDKWQKIAALQSEASAELDSLYQEYQSLEQTTDAAIRDSYMTRMDSIEKNFYEVIAETSKQNLDNEFGYFLLTHYDHSDIIDAKTRLELMAQLPQNMQQREAFIKLKTIKEQELQTAEGTVMPDFEMNDINGKSTTIFKEIKGKKVVILDFWASWCGPCRAEMPRLVELYSKYASKGLGIVGISLDTNAEAWKKETSRLGISWRQMSDLQGWNNAAAQMFAVRSIPFTVIVDGDGKILKKGLRGEAMDSFIADYLKNNK